ncbi:MAG: shikimate kinase [Oscillospiraceae bacterium]
MSVANSGGVIESVSKKTGIVISTGGGSLLNQENIFNLKMNSKIIFIDRKLENLLVDENRPLSKSADDIKKLYDERYPLYKNNCDFIIENNDNLSATIEKIKKVI